MWLNASLWLKCKHFSSAKDNQTFTIIVPITKNICQFLSDTHPLLMIRDLAPIYKLFSYSPHLSMKFVMFINIKLQLSKFFSCTEQHKMS